MYHWILWSVACPIYEISYTSVDILYLWLAFEVSVDSCDKCDNFSEHQDNIFSVSNQYFIIPAKFLKKQNYNFTEYSNYCIYSAVWKCSLCVKETVSKCNTGNLSDISRTVKGCTNLDDDNNNNNNNNTTKKVKGGRGRGREEGKEEKGRWGVGE